ncbi:MAG: DUF554 family protein [Verrucomicrobiota bacterium]
MIGTYLNAAGIVVGGLAGLAWRRPLSNRTQHFFKNALGLLIVPCGLVLVAIGLKGPFLAGLKQFGVVLLSLSLGKLLGRLLQLQKTSNRIGQFARERMAENRPGADFMTGFKVCTALFCVAPIGILGAAHDGLSGYFAPLLIKAAMDALAVMGFIPMFGWGVMFAAVPVLVVQGSISLLCARYALPFLEAHQLGGSVQATGGMLIFCVALVLFDIRKIHVTDYLPSLVVAPLLTWWWLR